MRIGRISIHTCGQADGAPFADRSTTLTDYSDGTQRKGDGRCFIPPWRLRWTGTQWRSKRSCRALAVAWMGKRYRPQRPPSGRARDELIRRYGERKDRGEQ